MAIKINEERMIEEHALKYEERVHSPIRRFTDKTFTPTRYWHIKGNQSTVDGGWGDVHSLIGPNSPTRYTMIENLPLCGIETLQPQIDTGEIGMDTKVEGDAITMDGTIKPYPNDFFMITYLKEPWIFRVTSVEYDTISSDSTYKIQYVLEYIDSEKVEQLMRQTVGEYTTVLENVGTDEQCIIETGVYESLKKINAMYDQMLETYLTFYYNQRYNCLLGDFFGGKIYDPLQEEFITKHKLFDRKGQVGSITLVQQFEDRERAIKYHKSIYRYIETKKKELLSNFKYGVFTGADNPQTAFARWMDAGVKVLEIYKDPQFMVYEILSDEMVDMIRYNAGMTSPHADLIRHYLRSEELLPEDIDLSLADAMMDLDTANLEVFFFTPIILYIIKGVVSDTMKKQKRTDTVGHFGE